MAKRREIRNSTAEFLIFQIEGKEQGVESGELVKDSVTEKISATASDGKNYMTQFYNLDAIISVGYRVNSIRATQFRQWATANGRFSNS